MDRQVIWTAEDGTTLEHLQVAREGLGWFADGIICGIHDGRPLRCHYCIGCDKQWRVRQVSVELPGRAPLRLKTNGEGDWETALAEPLTELAGCLDVDLALTPFTNTLPIRRLTPAADPPAVVPVVHIPLPELTWERMDQTYAALEPGDFPREGGRYKYQSPGFTAELPVDADGIVQDYPGLFRRLYPSDAHPEVATARPVPDSIPGYGNQRDAEDE